MSCAYYVGGSFYIILWMLYKNWGVLNILVFSMITIFFIDYCVFAIDPFVFFDMQYFSFRTLYT